LQESGLLNKYPGDSLKLLNAVFDKNTYEIFHLEEYLNDIACANPELKNRQEFRNLMRLAKA